MIDPPLTDDELGTAYCVDGRYPDNELDPDAIPDIAELRIILKQIAAQPETWSQLNWATQSACGTAYWMGDTPSGIRVFL